MPPVLHYGGLMKVFVAIPSHSGDVTVGTMMSVIQSMMDGTSCTPKVEFNVQCWVGDSIIQNARNVLIAMFLETDCTDFVFIDGDISWRSQELLKLLSHPVDVVGGGYRFKNDKEEYPMQWLPDPDGKGLHADPATGLIEIAGAPTGFLRFTRNALEKLVEAYGALWYKERLCPDLTLHNLCEVQLDNNVLRGEDYALCKKWRDIGGQVWVDPTLALTHTGHKDYHGNLGNWLLNRDKPMTGDEALRRIENLRRTIASPEVMKALDAFGEAA
jgi:hypothetical protein